MLAPILAEGTRREREIFDAQAAASKRDGDLEIFQVGRGAQMPWQKDGRRWHLVERVAHNSRPCRWEGAALEHVIDMLEATGDYEPVNWNARSLVEMTAPEQKDAWFLHALTGDEWLLTLKFRVRRNEFREDELESQLALAALDDLDELPIYGRSGRVRVKNDKGPWQEVTLTVHWLKEIDTPAFTRFLLRASESFLKQVRQAALNLEDLTPWKVLGRKWHLSRKGFPTGKRVPWEPDVIERLAEVLEGTLPAAEVDWTNQQVVYVRPAESAQVWAAVHTKRRGGVDLTLTAPAGRFALGRIAEFGSEREISPTRNGKETISIRFERAEQVLHPALREFLAEHATTV
jgi:excinuclease ABC subunit A